MPAETAGPSRLLAALLLVALASTVESGTREAPTARAEILVFAAASLTDALEEIGARYEARTGVRVLFSFAGSNTLARQIRAGAPADVFLSANIERMEELQRGGLVRDSDRQDLLSNRLAVIVPLDSKLSVETGEDLGDVRRLALGDPEAVPAGIYARRWLEGRGLWESLRDRVVPTLDVRAALAAVESGAADAGIVYRTDAAISSRVRVALEVPAGEAPRIVYPAAVLASSHEPHARAFLRHLRSPEARSVFQRLGFETLKER
jgi:molybdate transport system substrate-binding protein